MKILLKMVLENQENNKYQFQLNSSVGKALVVKPTRRTEFKSRQDKKPKKIALWYLRPWAG
jgi:hypothetical protein